MFTPLPGKPAGFPRPPKRCDGLTLDVVAISRWRDRGHVVQGRYDAFDARLEHVLDAHPVPRAEPPPCLSHRIIPFRKSFLFACDSKGGVLTSMEVCKKVAGGR